MTCLIGLGGRGPKVLPSSLLKADLCVAADSGSDLLMDLGRCPDVIVGDFDSVSPQAACQAFSQEKHPVDKDESDAELAMIRARKMGAKTWYVVGGSGGRFDHALNLLHLMQLYPEWKEWWLEEDVAYLLRSHEEIALRGKKGKRLSIFCQGKATGATVRAQGLRWSIDRLNWQCQVSLSNQFTDNEIRLRVEKGFYLILRPLEDALEFSV